MTSPPLDYEGQKERGDVAEKYVCILIEEKAALLADNARKDQELTKLLATCAVQVQRMQLRNMTHHELDLAMSEARQALSGANHAD